MSAQPTHKAERSSSFSSAPIEDDDTDARCGSNSPNTEKSSKMDVVSSDRIDERDLAPPLTAGTSESADMSNGMDTSVSSDPEEYGDNSYSSADSYDTDNSDSGADSYDTEKSSKMDVISSDRIDERGLSQSLTAGTSEPADMSNGMDTSVSSDPEEYGDNSYSSADSYDTDNSDSGADSFDTEKSSKMDVISSDRIDERGLSQPLTAGTSEPADMSNDMDTSVSSEEYDDNSYSSADSYDTDNSDSGADSFDTEKSSKLDVISSDRIDERGLSQPLTAGTSEPADMSNDMDTSVSSEEYDDNSYSRNGADSYDAEKSSKLDVISSDRIDERDLSQPLTAGTSEPADMSNGMDTSVSSDPEEYGDNSYSSADSYDTDNSDSGADSYDTEKSSKMDVISSDRIDERGLSQPLTAGTSESADMSDDMDTSVSSDPEEYGDDSDSVNGAYSYDTEKSSKLDVISSDRIDESDLAPPLTVGTSESADMSNDMDTSVSSDPEEYNDNSNSRNGADSYDTEKSSKLDVISSDRIDERDLDPLPTAGPSVEKNKTPKKSFKQAAKEAEITGKVIKTLSVVKLDRKSSQQ
ncbi:dentin sialophosphoprotein-like [Haliotis asinina]|uniref:dentin sialophosphoprotein-like n=1 Tax=Haliotis asinina TaxID=109174 RepID=UPI003531C808